MTPPVRLLPWVHPSAARGVSGNLRPGHPTMGVTP
jgi:hypothetical protein